MTKQFTRHSSMQRSLQNPTAPQIGLPGRASPFHLIKCAIDVTKPQRRPQRPRLQLRRENGRERHFAVDGLLENVFYCGADFRSIAIDYPDLLALFEWAARHHFEQNAFLGSRIFEHLDADCVGFSEVRLQPQFIVYFRHLALPAGVDMRRKTKSLLALPAERVRAHKPTFV